MMKIAICDDQKEDSKILNAYLERYRREFAIDFTILICHSYNELVQLLHRDLEIKIIFLEVHRKDDSGIETARLIRHIGYRCAIIFATASTDYYAESYDVNATHYLLKPISYTNICTALSRCNPILNISARYVELVHRRKISRVILADILYLEVQHNTCIYHATEDIAVISTLKNALAFLNDPRFVRCHKSFAINLNKMTSSSNYKAATLVDGTVVPVGRAYSSVYKKACNYFSTSRTSEYLYI